MAVPWGHIASKAWGSPKGTSVLCLHGWLDNANTFDTLIPLLPRGGLGWRGARGSAGGSEQERGRVRHLSALFPPSQTFTTWPWTSGVTGSPPITAQVFPITIKTSWVRSGGSRQVSKGQCVLGSRGTPSHWGVSVVVRKQGRPGGDLCQAPALPGSMVTGKLEEAGRRTHFLLRGPSLQCSRPLSLVC